MTRFHYSLCSDTDRVINSLLARRRDLLESSDVSWLRRTIRNRLAQHDHLRQGTNGDGWHGIGESLVVRVLQGRRICFTGSEVARHLSDRRHTEHASVLRGLYARSPGIRGDSLPLAPIHVLLR